MADSRRYSMRRMRAKLLTMESKLSNYIRETEDHHMTEARHLLQDSLCTVRLARKSYEQILEAENGEV